MTTGRAGTWAKAAIAVLGALCLSPSAGAQDWRPNRNVRFVVGLPPGGMADVTARLLGPGLRDALGQTFIVENLTGATGTIAAQAVAGAAPDGHTLMLALDATLVIVPALRRAQAPFDPVKQFTPVARVIEAPLVIFANKDFPGNNVADLVRIAKAGSGANVFYGSAGTGSSGHLLGEYLKQITGVEMTHVPYRGAAEALQDTVGGKITLMLASAASGMELYKAGRLKILGVTSHARMSQLPDVPTAAESGVPALKDFDIQGWAGVFAPTGTPEPVVASLNAALKKAMAPPDVAAKFTAQGFTPGVTSPQELAAQTVRELELWRKVGRDGNINLE